MPISATSTETKNSVSGTPETKQDNSPTWATAVGTWGEATGTWGLPGSMGTKETKNSVSGTAETKN